MKHPILAITLVSALGLLATTPAVHAADPPPNDGLADATGIPSAAAFTGHVADIRCATFDPNREPPTTFGTGNNALARSVWWTWTAPPSPDNGVLALRIETNQPLFLTSVELFSHVSPNGLNFVRESIGSALIDIPALVEPGNTYYIRAVTIDNPDLDGAVTLNLTGTLTAGPDNTTFDDRVPLSPDSPIVLDTTYVAGGSNLYYSWVPATTGYVEFQNRFPVDSSVTVYNGDEHLLDRLPDPPLVQAGQLYTVLHAIGRRAGTIPRPAGRLVVRPPASNRTFETRLPATETPGGDGDNRVQLGLSADGSATALWWSWTASENGSLLLPYANRHPLFNTELQLFRTDQPETPIATSGTYAGVAAGTGYALRLAHRTDGVLLNDADLSITFFPGTDAATIPDANLTDGIRQAIGLPPGTLVTPAVLLNLDELRIKAYPDCDDDDCFAPARVVQSLEGLEGATSMRDLWLQGGEGTGHQVVDLGPIAGLTSLESLRLPNALKGTDAERLAATEIIGGLTGLERLSLEQNNLGDHHIQPLATLTRLRILDVDDNQIRDLTPFAGLTEVRELDIDQNPITDLSPLANMQRLTQLDATEIPHGTRSIPPLRRLSRIESEDRDLSPFARHPNLYGIEVSRRSTGYFSSRITDLSPLANLSRLNYFSIRFPSSTGVTDVTPLSPRFVPGFNVQNFVNALDLSKTELGSPATQAVLQAYADAGTPIDTSRITTFPTRLGHLVPDGHLRAAVSGASSTPEDQLVPADLAGINRITTGWLTSLEGLQHATSLTSLEANIGWVSDLNPLSHIDHFSTLALADNFIHDVTPIADKTFGVLDLRYNPIDPETVPAAWLTDPDIKLDPFHELDPAQTIHDPELRAVVRAALGIPSTEPVTPDDLAGLTTLYAEELKIRSLAGLEHAVNLTGIAVRNNVLRDVSPIASLPHLRWARLSGNTTVVDLSVLDPSVRVDNDPGHRFGATIAPANGVVFADGYQLSSVRYLAQFPGVHTLFLSGNYLSDISVLTELPGLREVHLDNNYLVLGAGTPAQQVIDTLRARGATVVVDPQRPEVAAPFAVRGTAFRNALADALNLGPVPPAFTADQLAAATELDWNRDPWLQTGPLVWDPADTPLLARMTNLEYLKIEEGDLDDISFVENLTKLRELDLDFNDITDISPVANLTGLQELDLNNNDIRDISPLAGLTNLLSLDIDQNEITDISPIAGMVDLIELDLHGNQISDVSVLANFPDLASLDMRENQVADLSPLAGLDHLIYLDVSFNGLDPDAPGNATVLDAILAGDTELVLYPQAMPRLTIEPGPFLVTFRWTAEPHTSYVLRSTTDLQSYFNLHVINNGADPQPVRLVQPIDKSTPRFFDVQVRSRPQPR